MSDTQTPPEEPQKVGDDRTMLEEWLDYHRAVLRHKCAGLDDEQLRRRSCEPSNLSLLGLVCHLTDVERAVLRGVAGLDIPRGTTALLQRRGPRGRLRQRRRGRHQGRLRHL